MIKTINKSFLAVLLLMLTLPLLLSAQSLRTKVNSGNEHYHAGEFEQALTSYKDALLDDPLNEKVLFNQADALFKMEKYQEAREEYQKILATQDMDLAAKAHYNIGNSFFKEDKLTESIESYKRSLELKPDDFDAKYNLELARAKLKEQSEKQQQSPQQNQQQQQQDQQQQQGEQDQENQDQQNQQQQQEQQAEEQEQQEQQQQIAQNKDEISKEEAERILNALKEDEQDAQKKKAPVKVRGRRTDKDW